MAGNFPGFPPQFTFDPPTIVAMEAAFDKVCAELHCGHALTLVKMAAAMHIMALADQGERDPARLAQQALAAIGYRQPVERTAVQPAPTPAQPAAGSVVSVLSD
ncbi:MAG: hypothetical protein HXX10_21200 [Rhodoplanes sp.]|uniref:hypothetical protein n=1 Tax=Rhodoplanes sp. TaxID=1968906 RepID=UPI001806BCA3|nr:hypothetical protein [Rhodoplanes sp.]NVO16552.1 hypothetical protein [Rhodoplanes sp.]